MRDEIDSRIWVEHHAQFSADMDRLFQAIRLAFGKIGKVRLDAPWRSARPGTR